MQILMSHYEIELKRRHMTVEIKDIKYNIFLKSKKHKRKDIYIRNDIN